MEKQKTALPFDREHFPRIRAAEKPFVRFGVAQAFMERKTREKADIVYLDELLELSREATLEDETETKKRRATESSKEG